jgi:hypothetical protein
MHSEVVFAKLSTGNAVTVDTRLIEDAYRCGLVRLIEDVRLCICNQATSGGLQHKVAG